MSMVPGVPFAATESVRDTGNLQGKNGMRTARYAVGYCKPPKKHQFQPGVSGNPKGRPKGSKNALTFERLLQVAADREVLRMQKEQLDSAGLTQYGIKPKRRPRRGRRY